MPETANDLLNRLQRLDNRQVIRLWELFMGGPAPQVPVVFATLIPGVDLDALDIRRKLLDLVPHSSVPAHVAVVQSVPRDAQGKQNRAALAEQVVIALTGVQDEDALSAGLPGEIADAIETLVRRIWATYLPGVCMERRIDFFRSGGDSITAIRALADLNERLGTAMGLVTMFRYPRSDLFAACLESQEKTGLDTDQLRSRVFEALELIDR